MVKPADIEAPIARTDIQSLKALSIVAIVCCNAGFPPFYGGFLGIDVFFVLVGYFVTLHILSQREQDKFSFNAFYTRGLRHVFPILFIAAFASLPIAWMLLTPSDLKDYAHSLIALPLGMANFVFWYKSNFHMANTVIVPFAHTWSIATAIQFCILFPLLIMEIPQKSSRFLTGLLFFILAASLYADYITQTIHEATAFYMLPYRTWEFAAGALTALCAHKKYIKADGSKYTHSFLSITGIVLILSSFTIPLKVYPVPILSSLLSVSGTTLFLIFSTPETHLGRFLSRTPFIAIGTISYSVYVWHYLFIAFLYYALIPVYPTQALAAGIIAVSVCIAALTWHFIEKPFRQPHIVTRRFVYTGYMAGLVTLLGIGMLIQQHSGFSARFTSEQQSILSYQRYDSKTLYREDMCYLRGTTFEHTYAPVCTQTDAKDIILLWGDSQAASMFPGLFTTFPGLAQLTIAACAPVDYAYVGMQTRRCIHAYAAGLETIKKLQPKYIILAANWSASAYKNFDVIGALKHTLGTLRDLLPGVQIYILGSGPVWSYALPRILVKGTDNIYIEAQNTFKMKHEDALLRDKLAPATYISFHDLLCKDAGCRVLVEKDGKIYPLAWDQHHMTYEGSLYVAEKIKRMIEEKGMQR